MRGRIRRAVAVDGSIRRADIDGLPSRDDLNIVIQLTPGPPLPGDGDYDFIRADLRYHSPYTHICDDMLACCQPSTAAPAVMRSSFDLFGGGSPLSMSSACASLAVSTAHLRQHRSVTPECLF